MIRFGISRLGYAQGDNVKDMDNKGRRLSVSVLGSKHHMTTISENEALLIYNATGLYKNIAANVGCSLAVVKNIKAGYTWPHVTNHKGKM